MHRNQKFVADALSSDTDTCIVWPFAIRKSSGYGAFSIRKNGKKQHYDVHRYVCIEAHGKPSIDKLEAAHNCGNKLCLNPKHLYWASHKQNMEDAVRHGTIRGGGRYRQKFFPEQINFIKASGLSLLELARLFNSTVSHMGKLRRSEA